jgi:uncharacterized protein YndB with AHSA1/START domain
MKDMQLVVRKELVVGRDVEEAFDLFTSGISSWWPLDRGHSVFGEESDHPVMECRAGGRVYEVSKGGEEAEWGTVLEFDRPRLLRVRWHPGAPAADATEFVVRFSPAGSGRTSLELVHTGWEHFGDEARERHHSYHTGWDIVLGEYAAR